MIWGMTLHPGVEYCREVTKEEHLTLASLDCRPLMNKGVYHPLAHLIVKVNNCEHVLCYLEKGISHQQSLDFIFQEGDNLALSVEGTGIMHITGYSVKHSMYEDIKHDGSVIPPVKAELDETQYDMDSTISLEYLPETNDESFASQESQQRGRHLQQNSDKVESDEETDDESGLNHCERTGGTIICEGREGLTSSLQISAEDMEQLLRANRTEIDFDNQNLNESLRVVLRNAKKFHADSEGREMECEITDDVEMSKTDSNSTLQEHGLQDKCRSSERHSQQPSLEIEIIEKPEQGEGSHTLYQHVNREETDGLEVFENSEGAKHLPHKSAESIFCLQKPNERALRLESSSSQETSVQGADDCGNEEDGIDYEPQKATYSTKACLSTHEDESNQGMKMSGADTDDTSHSGLCSDNDEEEHQPHSTESDVTLSEDELPAIDISHHETSAGANEDGNGDQTFWRLQKSGVKSPTTRRKSPDFLLRGDTGKEQSDSTLTVRLPGNRKKLNSLEVRTNQQPQQSNTSESAASESNITEGQETSINRNQYKCTVCEKTFWRRASLMHHRKTHMVPEMQQCQSCNKYVLPKNALYKGESTRHDYFQCQSCKNKSVNQSENRSHLRSGLSVKLFKCHFCKKIFSSKRSLIIHKTTHTVKNQFLCQFCGKGFPRKESLHVHERLHNNNRSLECQFCGKMFVQKMQMILHERKHQIVKKPLQPHSSQKNIVKKHVSQQKRAYTARRPFKCKFCVKRFLSKDHVERHEKIHTGERPFQCQFCAKRFITKYHVSQHERIHTGERPFQCQFCAKRFITKAHVSQHERIHTGERPYKCQFCAKAFVQKAHCTQHERIHTGEKPYKCQFCERRFTLKAHATNHETRSHSGESPFKCQSCSNIFTTKSQLTQHEKIHINEEKFKCSFCNRACQSNSHRINHERTHTKEKPFKCSFCPKRFTRKSDMTIHTYLHTNEKPFECSFCEKRFVSNYLLVRHEEEHTSEREFKCQFCVKRFNTNHQVKQHERTHTAERKFKCSFCNKAFPSKRNRIIHERIHTNERPYKCSFCAQRFIQQSHVVCHERTHTKEKPFECSFCDARFAQKSSLNNHERAFHAG